MVEENWKPWLVAQERGSSNGRLKETMKKRRAVQGIDGKVINAEGGSDTRAGGNYAINGKEEEGCIQDNPEVHPRIDKMDGEQEEV